MTARDFCYWLHGHFELHAADPDLISTEQARLIRQHLALVFLHDIDPSMMIRPADKEAMDKIHHGEPWQAHTTTGKDSGTWTARC